MLFMFIAVKYMCCCPGDIDKLWSDSIRPISSWGPADSMLQSHSAIWWVIWEAALWISSFPIKTKNQKQMNNKSKTGLFKHKALKKDLLFFKNCSQPLVHDYPVRKPNEKEEYESKILLQLT